MRKYKLVEFQFDLEIKRTVRRLRTEHKNSKVTVAIDDLEEVENLNPIGEIQPINGREGQNRQHDQGQPGNNNIIYMANDRGRAIRDYDVLTPQVLHPGIVRPEV